VEVVVASDLEANLSCLLIINRFKLGMEGLVAIVGGLCSQLHNSFSFVVFRLSFVLLLIVNVSVSCITFVFKLYVFVRCLLFYNL
jgi:hypothetical protein